MGCVFEWDPRKADVNARKHGVAFDEATTCSGTHRECSWRIPISPCPKPGIFSSDCRRGTGFSLSHSPSGPPGPASSPRDGQPDTSGCCMKKKTSRRRRLSDPDTLRARYDFLVRDSRRDRREVQARHERRGHPSRRAGRLPRFGFCQRCPASARDHDPSGAAAACEEAKCLTRRRIGRCYAPPRSALALGRPVESRAFPGRVVPHLPDSQHFA